MTPNNSENPPAFPTHDTEKEPGQPPEGFKIIPREWLEAGNPLPEDTVFWGERSKNWLSCPVRGERTWNTEDIHATAQPLPCFQKGGDEPCPPYAPSAEATTQSVPRVAVGRNAPVAVQSPDQGPVATEPPAGYRLLTDEEKKLPLPIDALVLNEPRGGWIESARRGQPVIPINSHWHYATAQPLPCFMVPSPDQEPQPEQRMAKEQPGTHSLGPICGPHKGDPLSRQMLEKVIVAVMEEPSCPTCAGMNDLVATQGQRIAELERDNSALWEQLADRDKLVADYRTQLAASEKDRQWQPIATAPKGGGCAMFIVTNNITARNAHDHLCHLWLVDMVFVEKGEHYAFLENGQRVRCLTHWFPISDILDAAMKEAK